MITFEPTTIIPDDLPDKAKEQAEQSLFVWSARYGSLNEAKDHTEVGVFGFVPTDFLARRGYFWLVPRLPAPRKALAEGKLAFMEFCDRFPWNTFIYTEVGIERTRRFARFLGFRFTGTADGFHFYVRPEDEF